MKSVKIVPWTYMAFLYYPYLLKGAIVIYYELFSGYTINSLVQVM